MCAVVGPQADLHPRAPGGGARRRACPTLYKKAFSTPERASPAQLSFFPRKPKKEFNENNSLAQHTGSTQVPKEAQPEKEMPQGEAPPLRVPTPPLPASHREHALSPKLSG